MATYSSILAWEIPWTEEPGGLQSLGLQKGQTQQLNNNNMDFYVLVIKLFTYCAQSLSCLQLFLTPWTIAHKAPLSMGFPRQEYWNGLSFPSPGDLTSPRV